ncbi:uncharacterized protein LOC125559897 [Nematostella vectensis]|uniref:uncharacterized protein LOC125559897 n=1 Tax=Nematostella vectensis TaxID=45351 RepID=UPI00207733D4|nr:uncharacterized protein LOC125559897 [Nematostella vectensis]
MPLGGNFSTLSFGGGTGEMDVHLLEAVKTLAQLQCNFVKETIERFVDDDQSNKRYDLIHLIHSLYYVHRSDRDVLLERLYREKLAKKVILIIISQQSDIVDNSSMSKHVLRIIKKNNWSHEVFPFDRSEIFMDKSTEGNLLLDFLTHYKDFRVTAQRE